MLLTINIIGIIIILAIIYWFWLSHGKTKKATHEMTIVVANGVYDPSNIEVPANQSITLNFMRKDKSSCSEYVVFKDLDISAQLPLDKLYPLKLPALKPGSYEFSCQMGMYRGKLVVKN